MIRNQRFKIIIGIMLILFTLACNSHQLRFVDKEPIRYYNDIHPIPVPKSAYRNALDYYATVRPPRPIVKAVAVSGSKNARDVNSMDEVPASSWFIPRLGYSEISPATLSIGPTEYGPPVPPLKIIRVRKPNQNPRLLVSDKRNILYLLKCDPPEFPFMATTTSFIVNRLFWGFGYHVPEDHLFYFHKNDIKIDSKSNLDNVDIDVILSKVAQPIDGFYRCIASKIIEGYPLGPTPESGVRKDDPNDLFPHEDRRVLRALRIFGALTNMSDIGSDNTQDLYVGEEGKGYIKHYIIDFDDAFGTHAMKNNRPWAGFNHLFSLSDIFKNFVTAGLVVADWENMKITPWTSVGAFEADIFYPQQWKETHSFKPVRHSQPADNYWACKILGALSSEHIKALVRAAGYPEPDAEEYVIKTLIKRKQKILDYYLQTVTPLEFMSFSNKSIQLLDLRKELLKAKPVTTSYIIQFYDGKGKEIAEKYVLSSDSTILTIPISDKILAKSHDYVCLKVRITGKNIKGPDPAEFHLRNGKLVGVVH